MTAAVWAAVAWSFEWEGGNMGVYIVLALLVSLLAIILNPAPYSER